MVNKRLPEHIEEGFRRIDHPSLNSELLRHAARLRFDEESVACIAVRSNERTRWTKEGTCVEMETGLGPGARPQGRCLVETGSGRRGRRCGSGAMP